MLTIDEEERSKGFALPASRLLTGIIDDRDAGD